MEVILLMEQSNILKIQGKFGECRIQDCMEGLRQLPDKSYDLCVTDPPYGIAYNSNHYVLGRKNTYADLNGHNVNHGVDGNPNPVIKNDEIFFVEWLEEIDRVLKDDAGIIVFTSHKVFDVWKAEIEKYFTYKNMIVWVKNNWGMGDLYYNFAEQYELAIYATKGKCKLKGRRESNVVFADRIPAHTYNHQTPKPVGCIIPYLQTLKPQKVIEPFAGTGFVGQACEQLGIEWLAFEMDQTYIKDIEKRIRLGTQSYNPKKKQSKQTRLF